MLTRLRHAGARSRLYIATPGSRSGVRLSRSRGYASVTDLSCLLQPGTKLHGFTLQRTKHLPELELSALLFQHDQTGADYLHIAREDKNNVFTIAFKTNPPDATGVPHILEHVTLCGSEKYPVRDPFFKMLPRSLQNFMNAFTSSDHTMYPFATTNVRDFRNLMSVYLDATLHPLLKKSDFLQEGWRIGPENPLKSTDDAGQGTKDLVFKGVVYNEMKGQVSDATYLFYIRFMEQIFPSINNSGGDPKKITNLTYEQLQNFHRKHYHPSNAKIFTYGDQPVESHLEVLGEQLGNYSMEDVDRSIKDPISLQGRGPQSVLVDGPFDPLTPSEKQFKTSTTWMGGEATNIQETFAIQLAASLMMDGYGSPMYRALIESGLGTDFTPNTGYDFLGRKGVLTLGLNGVSEEDVPKVKDTIAATLRDIVKKGFDERKVEGALHQLELRLKHKTAQLGLGLMHKLVPGWFNAVDPMDSLAWNSIVNHFRAEHTKGRYLEGLVEKYFLNDETFTFTMAPNQNFAAEAAMEEAARLTEKIEEAVRAFPSEAEAHKNLRERELELMKEQDVGNSENLESLPTLHVNDIPREQPKLDVRDSTIMNGKTKVQWRETGTNGLTYFSALTLLKDLPNELRMLVPLFCDSLLRIGTKRQSMEELEDLIKLQTGGINFGYHSSPSPFDVNTAEEGLLLGGWALDRNVQAMYELLRIVLTETDFDSPKAKRMIKQLLTTGASGAVDGIAGSGHAYAMKFAEARLTPHARGVEDTAGLTQIRLITGLAAAENDETAMDQLVRKLKLIQGLVVTSMKERSRVALTCGVDSAGPNEEALYRFLQSTTSNFSVGDLSILNSDSMLGKDTAFSPGNRTFFPLPYQVSYAALALPTGPYTSAASPVEAILSKLLTHKHLHHEIREKGGAYGGGAYAKSVGGVFGMYSYRDPNPDNSLTIMENALRWAAERQWSDREMEEAKLSVFQGIDAPVSVQAEGRDRFLIGITREMEQERRHRLLDVRAADVQAGAEMLNARVKDRASVAVLGKGLASRREGWVVKDMGMSSGEQTDRETESEGVAVGKQ
ncbi:hypothetical protein M433DRAFT_57095 [Acidomyces richmondensis BFW]|nr:MAG: hypothetical protein FE78DRAFT_26555 [Acidomyces sp. 'richmondensis']KYG50444.1 hypothetical protein M433DRAFT_57095 [Acidomyces richmondensis BFW]